MSIETEQVLPQISSWLKDLAERIRAGHPNNAPYAAAYSEAADCMEQGNFEPAIQIVFCHLDNAINRSNFDKYSNWLACLCELDTAEIT